MQTTLTNAFPAELMPQPEAAQPQSDLATMEGQYSEDPQVPLEPQVQLEDQKIVTYITSWKDQLYTQRREKEDIWTECWRLYRGVDDWSDKEDWQSKISIPKAFNSVEQATSVIKRFLLASGQPFSYDPINPDDLITVARAAQYTELVKYFLEQAKYIDEFAVGLKSGFITGVGVWKQWWGYRNRLVTRVEQIPTPQGPVNQVVQREMLEGRLFLKAIDPYNFYWLPGSKFNQWVGTLELIEIPKYELMEMAEAGLFGEDGVDKVKNLTPRKTRELSRRTLERFQERPSAYSKINQDVETVDLLEYYGPIVTDGVYLKDYHCLIANDTTILKKQPNQLWTKNAPYVAFSPLSLPFRTDGSGLIERVREVDKAISKLGNLSIDTLLYRLMPVFEVNPEVYENPEDFETGLTPGKIFRRKHQFLQIPGIQPIQFEDVSQGALAVQAQLDRSHQEGALVSEIQQAIPRFRGYQSATEIEAKDNNQQSFFSSMAADIERQALQPIIEMAGDLVFQFIDSTGTDPRVAGILGVGADVIKGMSREEMMEMVQGDYTVQVSGISGQMEKADQLDSLVQFINILSQNPEQWLPQVNQDELLRRVLEAFRPSIRDVDNIIADPATVEARKAAASNEKLTPDVIAMLPQMIDMQHKQQLAQEAQQQQMMQIQQQMAAEKSAMDAEERKYKHEIELAKIKARVGKSDG